MKIKFFMICIFIFSLSSFSQQKNNAKLTVYDNYVLIVEKTNVNLKKGENRLLYSVLPDNIMDDAVNVFLSNNTDASFIEKRISRNFLTPEKIIKENIGKDVELISRDEKVVSGKLIYVSGNNAVIETEIGKVKIINLSKYEFTSLKYNKDSYYSTRLEYKVQSPKREQTDVKFLYFTDIISWDCEHIGYYDETKSEIDILSWARISNNSKFDFVSADLTLISGSVRKPESPERGARQPMAFQAKVASAEAFSQFTGQKEFEYYSYKYPEPVDLGKKIKIDLPLIEKKGIQVKKIYLYSHNLDPEDVFISLETENTEEKNLGTPIPKGIIKIFSKKEKEFTYIGSDFIPDTPVENKINLRIGKAFDLSADRKREEYNRITNRIHEESIKIELKNGSTKDVRVKVLERLQSDWEILSSNFEYAKIDAQTIEFVVPVGSRDSTTIEYRARFK